MQPVTTVGSVASGGLIGDFSQVVQGAGIWGCGIESQLESWYRFLIQPDPYQSLQQMPSPANATGLTPAEVSPVCDPNTPTSQIYAKAYPTIRELMVANMMGQQGIVSSLCPIHVTDMSADGTSDPLYGYRPAATAIIDRLKVALHGS